MKEDANRLPQMRPLPKNRQSNLGLLAQTGWLSQQSGGFRDWVASVGAWKNYEAGEIIFLAGDDPDAVYGLAEGAVEITFPLIGEEPVTVHRGEPGFWVGDSAILSNKKRLVTLGAAAQCRVFRLPAAEVRQRLERIPGDWRAFYELTHRNFEISMNLVAEALSLRPRARLARLFLRLADEEGAVPGSNEEFARLIGMTRSSMQRAIRHLVDAKAIETGYGQVNILDRNKLQDFVKEA